MIWWRRREKNFHAAHTETIHFDKHHHDNIDGIVQALKYPANRWLSLNIKFMMMMSSVDSNRSGYHIVLVQMWFSTSARSRTNVRRDQG